MVPASVLVVADSRRVVTRVPKNAMHKSRAHLALLHARSVALIRAALSAATSLAHLAQKRHALVTARIVVARCRVELLATGCLARGDATRLLIVATNALLYVANNALRGSFASCAPQTRSAILRLL